MTLCIAVGTEHFGLVAFDGNEQVLARLRDRVWMTGCGRLDVLAEIARQLAPHADPIAVLEPVFAHVAAKRLREDPAAGAQVRQATAFLTHANGRGYLARGLGCDGWRQSPRRGVLGNWPPGVTEAQGAAFRDQLQAAVDTGCSPWAMVKQIAAHALEVLSVAAHSVYGVIAVGVSVDGKDWYLPATPCRELVSLPDGAIAQRFEELALLVAPVVCDVAVRTGFSTATVPAVAIASARAIWRANRLFLQWTGSAGVASARVATSTSAYPASGAGTSQNGGENKFDAGTFAYGDTVYVTITPYPEASAAGLAGPVHQFRAQLSQIATMFDETTGKPLRTQDFTDGKYALKASDTAGKETNDDLFIGSTKTLKVGTVASPSTITKTIRIPFGECLAADDTVGYTTNNVAIFARIANTLITVRCAIVMPPGVTITAFKARLYRATVNDTAEAILYRINADQTEGLLATCTHSGTGTTTVSASLTETVGGEAYTGRIQLKGVSANTDAAYMWIELDYTIPSYDKGY